MIQICVTRCVNTGRSLHLPGPPFFYRKYENHETYMAGLGRGLNKIRYRKWLAHSRHSRSVNISPVIRKISGSFRVPEFCDSDSAG